SPTRRSSDLVGGVDRGDVDRIDLVARQHLRVVADQARGLQRELVGEGARPLGGAAADGDQHAVPRGGQLGGEAAGDRAGTQDGPAERCGGGAHGDVVVLHRWGTESVVNVHDGTTLSGSGPLSNAVLRCPGREKPEGAPPPRWRCPFGSVPCSARVPAALSPCCARPRWACSSGPSSGTRCSTGSSSHAP